MPIYEFECPIHGKFERIFPLSSFEEIKKDGILCDLFIENHPKLGKIFCGEVAIKESATSFNTTQIAPPTRIFINPKTGESQVATSRFEKPPYGYVDKELKGSMERNRFEKVEREKNKVIDEIDTYRMQARRDAHRKERHDHLNATMNATQIDYDENGREVRYHLDDKSKGLLKAGMADSKKRRNVPKKVTENYLAVNHMDKSNLQDAPNKR